MKNSLVNLLLAIVTSIIIVEGIQWGFYLMTMADTLLFYLGFAIVALIMFFVGWYIAKKLNEFYLSDDKFEEKEKNEEQ